MNISMLEFLVLVDTLRGSLRIADGAVIFGYKQELRSHVLQEILNRSAELTIAVRPSDPPPAPPAHSVSSSPDPHQD